MSKTVDERVVSMQFDNRHFESNVKTSMSTLDKLKRALKLDGASKGLQTVADEAKKCDFNPMGKAVDSVKLKFSAMEVMAVTALTNITNSAVNAGKRIVSALTIDPVKTGFSEYETKINAIQTIMSNTASKGTTMADVTEALNKLNLYADKTIYNFAEMTKNIGTFTAAGVGLTDATSAIQGIANLAAASGSTSQQAATAMYQLSQALSSGTVKLMDWNSVVNAGMGGEKFQEALKATAREYGIAVDEIIEKNGSFRESLSEGWISADILNETLRKFTVEGAKEYAKAAMESGMYTAEQAEALIKEAQAMEDAATKVKTLTQLFDTLKEAAQSGWSQTWELVVGNFEESKEFFSGLSDMIGEFIGGSSGWTKLTKQVNKAGLETEEFENRIREAFKNSTGPIDGVTESLVDLSKITKELKRGNIGEDVMQMQDGLKELGYDLGKFGKNLDGLDGKFGPVTKQAVKAFQAAKGIKDTGILDAETLDKLKDALQTSGAELSSVELDKIIEEYGTLADAIEAGAISVDVLLAALEGLDVCLDGIDFEDLGKLTGGSADRNNLLEEVMSAPWDKLISRLGKAGVGAADFEKSLRAVIDAEEEGLSDELIKKYGSLQKAFQEGAVDSDLLKKAIDGITESLVDLSGITKELKRGNIGDDVKQMQAGLKHLGYDLGKFGENLDGLDGKFGPVTQAAVKAFQAAEGLDVTGICDEATLNRMKELTSTTYALTGYYDDLIDNITKKGGRELLLESLSNVLESLISILTTVRDAWNEVFAVDADTIYNAIEAINSFTTRIKDFITANETVDKLKRTFKGLFAILKIVRDIIWTGVKVAFKVLGNIFGGFDADILETTACIGDMLVAFSDWISENNIILKTFEKIVDIGSKVIGVIVGWLSALYNLPVVQESLKSIRDIFVGVFGGMAEWFAGLKETDDVGSYIISGLINGLKNGIRLVVNVITTLATAILSTVKEILGIHSPSTETYDIGNNFILGFVNAIKDGIKYVLDALGEIFDSALGVFNLNTGSLLTVLGGGGLIYGFIKIAKAFEGFADIAELADRVDKILKTFNRTLKNFNGVLRAIKFKVYAEAIKSLAIAIAILAGSLLIISLIPSEKLWGAVGALAAVMGMLAILITIMGLMSKLSTVTSEGKATVTFAKIAVTMLAMSAALTQMVLCVRIAGSINESQLTQGLAVVGGFIGIMTLMMILSRFGGDFYTSGSLAAMLKSVASCLLVMTLSVAILGMMKPEKIIQGVIAIGAFGGIIVGLIAATKLAGGPKKLAEISAVIKSVGSAMLLMALSVAILGFMKPEKVLQGVIAITAFGGIIVGLIAATKLAGGPKKLAEISAVIKSVGTAILFIALAVAICGLLSVDMIAKGLFCITAFGGIIVGLIAATKLMGNGKQIKQAGDMIRNVAIAMLLMTVAVAVIGLLPEETILKGIIVLSAFTAMIAVLMSVSGKAKYASKNATTLGKLITMVVMVAVVAGALYLLSTIDWGKLAIATAALCATLLTFAFSVQMIGKAASKNSTGLGKLITMVALVAVVAAGLYLISLNPLAQIAIAAAALCATLLTFALSMQMVGKAASKNASSMGKIITMIVALAVVAGALYLLAQNPWEQTIAAAVSLSVAMMAFALTIKILGTFSPQAFLNAMLGAVAVAGLALAMLVFVAVLAAMQGIENATTNAMILANLAVVMTLVLIPLTLIGAAWPAAFLGVAALGLMAVAMLVFVGVLAAMSQVQNAQANADLLIGLMTTMADILIKISLVAPLALIAVAAITALGAVMLAMGVLAVGIGALMEKFPKIKEFLNTGIPVLEQLAYALGSMISNFLTGLASGLPDLGLLLSQFMVNATPFIAGVKMVDDKVLKGVSILTAAILELTVANLLSQIVEFVTFGSSLADLGTELTNFYINALPFITGATALTPSMLEGVKMLAETILLLTKADILNGLTSWLTGGSSLEDFGSQLAPLGGYIRKFVDGLGNVTDDDLSAATKAATILQKLAEVSKSIPNSGGVLGWLVGDNDLGDWGPQLEKMGTNVSKFILSIREAKLTDDDQTLAERACNIMKKVLEVSKEIPNSGGALAWLVGDNDVGDWSGKLGDVGSGVIAFVKALRGDTEVASISDDDVNKAGQATSIMKAIIEASQGIPNSGGALAWLVGDNSVSDWSEKLPLVGAGVVGFVKELRDANITENESVIAGHLASLLTTLSNLSQTINKQDLYNLVEAIAFLTGTDEYTYNFTHYLSAFVNDLKTINSADISLARANLAQLFALLDDIKSYDTSTFQTFKTSMINLGRNIVDGILEGLTSDTLSDKLSTAATTFYGSLEKAFNIDDIKSGNGALLMGIGTAIVTAICTGIRSSDGYNIQAGATMLNPLTEAANSVVNAIVDYIKSDTNYSKFEGAGKYCVQGFADGITENLSEVTTAATTLGNHAYNKAKQAIDAHSPSKKFMELGRFATQGFANGIASLNGAVKASSVDMAKTAINGTKNVIARLVDAVNSDIDTQPTIRPVLDLSEVTNGANSINGLFSMRPSVGLLSNVGSINAMMNESQNGANRDVVDAVNKLSNKLDNISSETNIINGITYDDGSNITEAVKTIVRAARVERRI